MLRWWLGLVAYTGCGRFGFEPDGDANPILARDCLDAFQRGVTTDSVIAIDPDGANVGQPPFPAYCDMTTAGGGWTLVYAYGFANYEQFEGSPNAVTPRPSWPFSAGASAPVSTTVPISPADRGALEFTRWPSLGASFLVTSTINHWIACTPADGSLVTATGGVVQCQLVRQVATTCTGLVPDKVDANSHGLQLTKGSLYYYWDGSMETDWPTHDPCGANAPNHLTGVADPRGAIFLRR